VEKAQQEIEGLQSNILALQLERGGTQQQRKESAALNSNCNNTSAMIKDVKDRAKELQIEIENLNSKFQERNQQLQGTTHAK
jgi:hypothetical protein